MGHRFGDLLGRCLHRKRGLSQFRLANSIDQPPSVISEMCQGKRLTGPQARSRVVQIIAWLQEQEVLYDPAEANALLDAAGFSPLSEELTVEAGLVARFAQAGKSEAQPLKSPVQAGSDAMVPIRINSHNLPDQFTHFIGRSDQIPELVRLIRTRRMVTLTGAGGVGKTRLALEVAGQVLDAFADGAWFVDLAPLADAALLPQALLETLKVPQQPDQATVESLTTYLGMKDLLLILDNCEHLVEGTAQLAERILCACPYVALLATSREALQIPGEFMWQVPSLTRPPLRFEPQPATPDILPRNTPWSTTASDSVQLEEYEAVRLLVERVQQIEPGFKLQPANAWAVAHICSRLDGIPLALEMAAAWSGALTIEEIAARLSGALDARFQMLANSSRTVARRQQTLRTTFEWSYALLSPAEQRLFLRLPVFAGSWTLDAAENICADTRPGGIPRAEVLPLLAALIKKSLVIADRHDGQTHYSMLETIRQFAAEKMGEQETGILQERHFAYFLELAENPPVHLLAGPAPRAKMSRLHGERENIRASDSGRSAKAGSHGAPEPMSNLKPVALTPTPRSPRSAARLPG